MNKYYLIKRILSDEALISKLKVDESELNWEPIGLKSTEKEHLSGALKRSYSRRVKEILNAILGRFIEDLGDIGASDVISLMKQRDYIITRLNGGEHYNHIRLDNIATDMVKNIMKEVEMKEILENTFCISMKDIVDYENALALMSAPSREVVIGILRNDNRLGNAPFEMTVKNNKVSVDQMKDAVLRMQQLGYELRRITVDLSIEVVDIDEKYGFVRQNKKILDKKAVYFVDTNCFRVYEKGMPIYENNDGVICDNPNALADCLM